MPENNGYVQRNALTRWQQQRREMTGSGSRTGQVDNTAQQSSWERYVASWPAWRDPEACGGACPSALVCGRAQVCVRDARVPGCVTYALARLSARVGERAPGPDRFNHLQT